MGLFFKLGNLDKLRSDFCHIGTVTGYFNKTSDNLLT